MHDNVLFIARICIPTTCVQTVCKTHGSDNKASDLISDKTIWLLGLINAIHENRAEGASTSQAISIYAAQNSRTTALNNIAVTKATTLKEKTGHKIETLKLGTAEDKDSVLAPLALSDEDDSLEREVALNSPEKGKDFHQLSKVC